MKNKTITKTEENYYLEILSFYFNKFGFKMNECILKEDDKDKVELIFKGEKL